MTRLFWICIGGAIGTGARYMLGAWMNSVSPGFPLGTMLVNSIGSFLIAFIMQASLASQSFSPTLRLVLTTGFLGGFTTYSTFNYETLKLYQNGDWTMAALNLGGTVLVCLISGACGFVTASKLIG